MSSADGVRTISFKALQRARTTIEDFVSSYFPYHGLKIPQDFFRYLDVLVYVEATIYQLDEDNEALAQQGAVEPTRCLLGESVLSAVLEERGLLDDPIRHELRQGDQYWTLERRLCAQMLTAAAPYTPDFSLADVIQTHEAKSFDYRVLNLLLFRLRKATPDAAVMEFLRVDEMLVDIGDDLTDYEDDVIANSFNIFRAFVHLYGREAEMHLVERISQLEKRHAQLLAALPAPLQQHFWKRHREASTDEGADRWQFPRPLLDEAAFRQEMAEHEERGGEAAPTQQQRP